MLKALEISGRKVGKDNPCFIIAEAGVNHNGSLELALRLVDGAVKAGADAVKFQTFNTEKMISPTAAKAEYQKRNTKETESQFEMAKQMELNHEEFQVIALRCKEKGITFMSTPFEEDSADFLETIGIAAYKMASGELTNLPFLAHVARKRKPMIVSTGMADLQEVKTAVRTIRSSGNTNLILLHCTSNYPTPPEDVNLKAMKTLANTFNVPVGYSDHTAGIEVAIAAVALGACVIEKHFTLDHNLPGPDQKASLDIRDFIKLVESIRKIEKAFGTGAKEPTKSEISMAKVVRKSLHVKRDLSQGHSLGPEDIVAMRPGTGISPALIDQILGRKLNKAIRSGTILKEEDLV